MSGKDPNWISLGVRNDIYTTIIHHFLEILDKLIKASKEGVSELMYSIGNIKISDRKSKQLSFANQ